MLEKRLVVDFLFSILKTDENAEIHLTFIKFSTLT